MDHGITLSANGRSWLSLSNPHRDGAVADEASDYQVFSADNVDARASIYAVIAAAAVTGGLWLTPLPSAVAIIAGLAVLAGAWLVARRRFGAQANNLTAGVNSLDENIGPRRLTRGDFLAGPRADAADRVVGATVQILESPAYRSGALGDPQDTYWDVMEWTWDLLWRLHVIDTHCTDLDRLERRTSGQGVTDDIAIEVQQLRSEANKTWLETTELVQSHELLASTVEELQGNSNGLVAREQLAQMASKQVTLPHEPGGLDALAARVSAAISLADNAAAHRDDDTTGGGTGRT